MVLTELRIAKIKYGEREGQYEGKASFTGELGDVAIRMTPEMVERIFEIAADAIIAVSREAAQTMCCQVIQQREGVLIEVKSIKGNI